MKLSFHLQYSRRTNRAEKARGSEIEIPFGQLYKQL